nr:hypothetical protein [Verrucomicrobium spinosum]
MAVDDPLYRRQTNALPLKLIIPVKTLEHTKEPVRLARVKP